MEQLKHEQAILKRQSQYLAIQRLFKTDDGKLLLEFLKEKLEYLAIPVDGKDANFYFGKVALMQELESVIDLNMEEYTYDRYR